jgi:hypothetical protein
MRSGQPKKVVRMKTGEPNKPTLSTLAIISRVEGVAMLLGGLKNALHRLGETDCDGADFWRDPLSHPAIQSMSLRELADLPLSAGFGKRTCNGRP